MKKQLRKLAFVVALGVAPLGLLSVAARAQQGDDRQQAYQAGYQNGVNDAQRHQPMNMNNDQWRGDRASAYQQGYQEGYGSVAGSQRGEGYGTRAGDDDHGQYRQDGDRQRAYQSGYQRGVSDGQRNRGMHADSDDWKGDNLQAYRQGYEEGYRSVAGSTHREHDDDIASVDV